MEKGPRIELTYCPKSEFTASVDEIRQDQENTLGNMVANNPRTRDYGSRRGENNLRYIQRRESSPCTKQETVKKEPSAWSNLPAPLYDLVIDALTKLCHDRDTLARSGYKVREMTQDDLEGYAKCLNCGERKRALDAKSKKGCFFHPKKQNHQKRQYKPPCCGKRQPCTSLPAHEYAPVPAFLAENWKHYKLTPRRKTTASLPRRAVALDCEMIEVEGGDAEVAQVCAVDILTGEVVVEKYVVPTKLVTDWRTPWSGMSPQLMQSMQEAGKTVEGWEAARDELWKQIDQETILVGHSLQHDLDIMRMVHLNVIDMAILSREAVAKDCKQNWGLKRLCKQMLDRDIQQSRRGHDCLEDAMATREVVLWCIRHPDQFRDWAESQRLWMKKANAHWKWKQKESEKAAKEPVHG